MNVLEHASKISLAPPLTGWQRVTGIAIAGVAVMATAALSGSAAEIAAAGGVIVACLR